jgi:3-oxoacyl-[acyl-carrier protein] reductase
MSSDGAFQGKVALVSGAAHGIGREIVRALLQRGATVWATDVLPDELGETVRSASVGTAHAHVADLTDPEAVGALVADIVRRHSAVDILVHAAGGVRGQVWKPIEDVTADEWRSIVAANLDAAFHLSHGVVPGMKAKGWGRIVTISSGAGRSYSQTGIHAYASAKAGLIGFTRQIARELGPFGITANCIAPGFVLSNPSSQRQWDAMGPDGQRAFIDSLAVKRLGRPEDIASAVLFFASDDAGYITGQTISVDGGRWMLG